MGKVLQDTQLALMLESVVTTLSVMQVLDRLSQTNEAVQAGAGSQMQVGTLDAELEPLLLSKAAQHGLNPSWVTRLATLDPQRPQVISIMTAIAHSSSARCVYVLSCQAGLCSAARGSTELAHYTCMTLAVTCIADTPLPK